ncbi:hypothetical protein [Goodfellowiella coeruleoviolacea]|uniref:Uncharacterized protein n=1 Tax=Goodfellowiella coeruleoviolacea TaxID=334858 RepID=A0AAE3GCV6_9PSEU|nr:hypothetical protein [Goodfellowiella coeruleoviolacea]MCP2164849.1 hypothetical protein [Goodfellowiella coeruleoviolacea]
MTQRVILLFVLLLSLAAVVLGGARDQEWTRTSSRSQRPVTGTTSTAPVRLLPMTWGPP